LGHVFHANILSYSDVLGNPGERKLAFEGILEDVEVIGWTTCGGCPGKRAVLNANRFSLSSCSTYDRHN